MTRVLSGLQNQGSEEVETKFNEVTGTFNDNGSVLCSLSCVQLCDPKDCSPQVPLSVEILQARILEWVAMPSSRWSSQPRDWTWVSCIAGRFFTMRISLYLSMLWRHREELEESLCLYLSGILLDGITVNPKSWIRSLKGLPQSSKNFWTVFLIKVCKLVCLYVKFSKEYPHMNVSLVTCTIT